MTNRSSNAIYRIISSQSLLTGSTTFSIVLSPIITFVDYDGKVFQTGLVQYGSSAIAPMNPTRTGYMFSGWNPSDLSNITGDRIFTGEYVQTIYTLSFDSV
jgi:uncharacterized repeat protein (TIGR02543 family)